MIRGSGDSSTSQDPHVMEVASSLVNDVIEKAREEVLKRKVSFYTIYSIRKEREREKKVLTLSFFFARKKFTRHGYLCPN